MIVAAFPVFQPEEDVTVQVPAPGLLEVFGREKGRHEDLLCARSVELATDDRLHFAQDPEAKRKKVVRAGADLTNEPSAGEEGMAHVARIGRRVADSGDEGNGEAHGTSLAVGRSVGFEHGSADVVDGPDRDDPFAADPDVGTPRGGAGTVDQRSPRDEVVEHHVPVSMWRARRLPHAIT